jgi:hypothetical protein
MSSSTTKLALYLPGGGSSGLITPDETLDVDRINDNMKKLDLAVGVTVCTSGTHPATPFIGQQIVETDTKNTLYWTGAVWTQTTGNLKYGSTAQMNALAGVDLWEGLMFSNITDGQLYYRTATAWILYASKLALINQQLDTANSLTPLMTQVGTGKITGNGTVQVSETVTFPVAFSAVPRVVISATGYRTTGAFNDNGLSGSTNWASASSKVPASFLAIQTISGTTLSASFDYYYDWIAIGPA